MPTFFEKISTGIKGTDQTVARMVWLVQQSLVNPELRPVALSIIENADVDPGARIAAVHKFVSDTIRYVPDPVDVETVQAPLITLKNRFGDCDDQAVLVAALLMALGTEVRFKVVGDDLASMNHVYVQALTGAQWVDVDTVPYGLDYQVEKTYHVKEVEPMIQGYIDLKQPTDTDRRYDAVRTFMFGKLRTAWNSGLFDATDLEEMQIQLEQRRTPEYQQLPMLASVLANTVSQFRRNVSDEDDSIYRNRVGGLGGWIQDVGTWVAKEVWPVVRDVVVMPDQPPPTVPGSTYPAYGSGAQPPGTFERIASNPLVMLGAVGLVVYLVTRK